MRETKFRQAAFVYLHVAILYEAASYVRWRMDLLPTRFGPPVMWLLLGAAVPAAVIWGLIKWQNVWLARAVWLIWALRLPGLIRSGFFPAEDARAEPAFYVAAIVVALINMWMLARAGWDL